MAAPGLNTTRNGREFAYHSLSLCVISSLVVSLLVKYGISSILSIYIYKVNYKRSYIYIYMLYLYMCGCV